MAGLGLFQGFGIELEYMIVDAQTFDVRPIADRLLSVAASDRQEMDPRDLSSGSRSEDSGSGGVVGDPPPSDIEHGPIAWSNELVLHVIELKNNGPTPDLDCAEDFQVQVQLIDRLLSGVGARLMPGGAHPWMDPTRETRLWPHEYREVYAAYDRIFGCSGHGWSNLQATHLNLPFRGTHEFGALHAAVRLVLPLLPALAASSPVLDGRLSGLQDTRLIHYGTNQRDIPEVAGAIIPEAVFTPEDYRRRILEPIYAAIAPQDPAGILQHEFLNSRGAIARFERSAIEVRLMDIQECPAADLAIARLVVAVTRALVEERWQDQGELRTMDTQALRQQLDACIGAADQAEVADSDLLAAFGRGSAPVQAGELWKELAHELLGSPELPSMPHELQVILGEGPLARRLTRALGDGPDHDLLIKTYHRLSDCLHDGEMFRA